MALFRPLRTTHPGATVAPRARRQQPYQDLHQRGARAAQHAPFPTVPISASVSLLLRKTPLRIPTHVELLQKSHSHLHK